jgi:hypothetical protein
MTQGHVKEFKAWWSKLRRRKFAKTWKGGFYNLEVTNEQNGWHLHLHALVDARWIDGSELSRQWCDITGGAGYIVKVQDCRKKDYLHEVTKYAVKGSELARWTPDQIRTFIEAFDGIRAFGVFGSLYGKRTEFREWLDSIRGHKPLCTCGSCNIRYLSEAEALLDDFQPTQATAARPPPPPEHPELTLGVSRNFVL